MNTKFRDINVGDNFKKSKEISNSAKSLQEREGNMIEEGHMIGLPIMPRGFIF